MKSGKFWHLVPNRGFEAVLAAKIKLKTLSEAKTAIHHAYIDEDLFDFLQADSYRESLQAVLVGRCFPGQLGEVQAIAKTDQFLEPPRYFREACAIYINRLREA